MWGWGSATHVTPQNPAHPPARPPLHQVLTSATEAAEMILRVDDIIKCAPRQRQ
jgi:hypothetical protein